MVTAGFQERGSPSWKGKFRQCPAAIEQAEAAIVNPSGTTAIVMPTRTAECIGPDLVVVELVHDLACLLQHGIVLLDEFILQETKKEAQDRVAAYAGGSYSMCVSNPALQLSTWESTGKKRMRHRGRTIGGCPIHTLTSASPLSLCSEAMPPADVLEQHW